MEKIGGAVEEIGHPVEGIGQGSTAFPVEKIGGFVETMAMNSGSEGRGRAATRLNNVNEIEGCGGENRPYDPRCPANRRETLAHLPLPNVRDMSNIARCGGGNRRPHAGIRWRHEFALLHRTASAAWLNVRFAHPATARPWPYRLNA